jgi:3-hydroxyacyl-CoA dehydrogenase
LVSWTGTDFGTGLKERLDVKKSLFAELENLVTPDTVLATNTSSLSVTSIAAGLKHPGGWRATTSSTRCR